MPQKTQAQRNFPASVREVVLSGFCGKSPLFPFYTKDEKTTAENNLRLLSVLDLKKRSYQELSGGQQQRVLLARALCATEKILILDEPTAALDPHATAEFYDLILKLNKEHGITVLIISHDFEAAKRYATHVLLLDHHGNYFGKINDFLLSNEAKSFGKDHADVNHS